MRRGLAHRLLERARPLARWLVSISLPLAAIPGPCSTFDDEAPSPAAPTEAGVGDGRPDGAPSGPSAYLALPDAVRACALVARCATLPYSIELSLALPMGNAAFGACVHFLAAPVPPSRLGFALQRGVLEKIAAARDCKEALDAVPVELLVGDDPRCPKTETGSTCYDGAHAVSCSDGGFGTFSRCAEDRGGPACVEIDIPDGGGRMGVCGKGACPGFVPEAYCTGTVVHTCDPRTYKLETSFDCAWLGLSCGRGAEGYATCTTPGTDGRCDTPGAAACAGDDIRLCTYGEEPRLSTFACAEIGASCGGGFFADGGGTMPVCLRREAECSPHDAFVGGCEGNTIALCVDGRRTRFDCAAAGKQCDGAARACL